MKLIMTLLVRDEADVLEANLWYHLEQGVDFIIATNNLSQDGSHDILQQFARQGHVQVIQETTDDYAQSKWVTRMARMASEQFGADWVINNDADEFWWPQCGTIKGALEAVPKRFGSYRAPRFNFVPRPRWPGWFFDQMFLKETKSHNVKGRPLPAKLCHRAVHDVVVRDGSHRILGTGLECAHEGGELEILHFPVRSYMQFERKIRHIAEGRAKNPETPAGTSKDKRALYETYRDGRLPELYDKQVLRDGEIDEAIRAGRVSVDLRLRRFFYERGFPPVAAISEKAATSPDSASLPLRRSA